MAPLDPDAIEAFFDVLAAAIGRDRTLANELLASRAEFFPGGADPTRALADEAERALAGRRHLEWFLLERPATGPLEARISALIERSAAEAALSAAEILRSLAGSYASVFEVKGVDPSRAAVLWDLAGLLEGVALEPDASRILAEGDVIAGRVFPIGESFFIVSRAAALWRDPRLLAALKKDLDRARAARPTAQRVRLRLRQSEIEAMFHALAADVAPGESGSARDTLPVRDALGETRALLLTAGVGPSEVDAILVRLAREDPPRGPLLPGGIDVLGEILDSLAFETSVDLEAARRTLLAAWIELRAASVPRIPEASRGRPTDVAAAVAEFDRRRQQGAPLEVVFADLERDLGLAEADDEPGPGPGAELDSEVDTGADDEDTPAPDFPGVVAAVVEEFLWDVEREHGGARSRRFEGLRSLGRFADNLGVFENLSGRDLVDFTCRWLPESGQVADAEAARDLLDGLSAFCAWTQANHAVPLEEQFGPVLTPLRESLPRLIEANRLCSRRPIAEGDEWFEYSGPGDEGLSRFVDFAGETVPLTPEPRLAALLQEGDVVRGRRNGSGVLTVSACYPGELRRLQRS